MAPGVHCCPVMQRRRVTVATLEVDYAVEQEASVEALLSLAGQREARGQLVVLKQRGQVLGVGAVDVSRPVAEVTALVVAPGRRFRGAGRRLVQELLALARVHGCRTLRVHLPADAATAAGFFRSLGFEALNLSLERPL